MSGLLHTESQMITRDYQGMSFSFREDGYFNMTKAAKHFGKFLPDFIRSVTTIEYMAALSKTGKFPELIQAKSGNGGGTFGHPKIAIRFAQRLSRICTFSSSAKQGIGVAFLFNTSAIRVVTIDGNPWFVANDIREVLCLFQGGKNFDFLGNDEQLGISKSSGQITSLFEGRSSRIKLISESGLYKMVMRSDKPQAKPFQDWVTKTVLPAIRKDGGYIKGEEKVVTG